MIINTKTKIFSGLLSLSLSLPLIARDNESWKLHNLKISQADLTHQHPDGKYNKPNVTTTKTAKFPPADSLDHSSPDSGGVNPTQTHTSTSLQNLPVKPPVSSDQDFNPLKNDDTKKDITASSPPAHLSYLNGTVLYVHSQEGLNMRARPDIKADKLGRMAYGDRVTVTSPPQPQNKVTHDNIENIWIRIKFQDKEGYAFGGYLSRFPIPNTASLKAYTAVFKTSAKNNSTGIDIKMDKTRVKNSQAIVLENASFNDGFLVARRLFNIPVRLKFPIKTKLKISIVNDPEIRAKLSNISLEFRRNKYGNLIGMTFFEKGINWGRKSTINVIDGKNIRLQIFNFSG